MLDHVFENAWRRVKDVVPYKKAWEPDWKPKKGYTSGAVSGRSAPKLEIGQIVKTEVKTPSPFRLIIIGTPFGNVVLFDHPTGQGTKITAPVIIQKLYGRNRDIRDKETEFYTGFFLGDKPKPNIGERLHSVFGGATKDIRFDVLASMNIF